MNNLIEASQLISEHKQIQTLLCTGVGCVHVKVCTGVGCVHVKVCKCNGVGTGV